MTVPIDWRRIEVFDDDMAEVYRPMTPTERLAIALDANRTMRLRLAAHFRTENPEWSDAQIATAISRRLLGDAWIESFAEWTS